MKKILTFSILFLICIFSYSQDAKEILKKSFEKCQSVQNGYYEMTRYMKNMSDNDTAKSSFHCSFKKLKDDTLYSSSFYYKGFWNDEYGGDVLYTGDDFVITRIKDSTAIIRSKKLWAKDIESSAHNYIFYSPLTDKTSYPLPKDSDYINNSRIFKFIGEETVKNLRCFHVQVNVIPVNNSTDILKALRIEHHFWINKADYIPVQFSVAYDLLMNNDTMYQYEVCTINKYEVDNLKDETVLTLNSIPSYFKIQDYVPYKSSLPLPLDTIAPDWELFSLTDEKVNLKSLQGQLVLVDFFYKACYPCMKALPALQALHEKYKNSGLKVIGIDPYDDKEEDDIVQFLSKRGVTYTVLLGGKEASKEYRVSGYPTIFLIDKQGKIIFIQVGYGEDTEIKLEELIKKNL